MGYIKHNAIIVTSSYDKWIEKAHEKASEIFEWVSPIAPETVNGYQSFFVPPDGSKEGWDASFDGDTRRDAFKEWLREQAYEDGSSPLEWVELAYGSDDRAAQTCDHAWTDPANAERRNEGRPET